MNGSFKHEHRKSQKMQAGQGFRQPFIVPRQPPKTSHPSEAAFNNPALWQQHKTFLGFGQFDHNQFKPMLSRSLSWLLAGVALVNKGHLDRITGGSLDVLGQVADLSSLLFVGRRDLQGQQVSQGINRLMDFAALFAFMTIITSPLTAFRARLQGSPSKIAADG